MERHDDSSRKGVHLKLCLQSLADLQAFAVAHGVSLTALIDALGHTVAAPLARLSPEELRAGYPNTHAAVELGRRIDAGRRRRPRNGLGSALF